MVHLGYLSLRMNRLACGVFCAYLSVICFGVLFLPGTVLSVVPIVTNVLLEPPFAFTNFIAGAYLLSVALYSMMYPIKENKITGQQIYWKEPPKPQRTVFDPFKKLLRLLLNPPDIYILCFALIFHVGVVAICYHYGAKSYPDSPPIAGLLLIITGGVLVLWVAAIWHEEDERHVVFDSKVTWNCFMTEAFDIISKRGLSNIIIVLNGMILVPLSLYFLLKPEDESRSEYVKYINLSKYDKHLPTTFLLFMALFGLRSSYNIVKEGFIEAANSLRTTAYLNERYNLTVLTYLLKKINIYEESLSKVLESMNRKMSQRDLSRVEKELIEFFKGSEAEKPFPLISATWNIDDLLWESKPSEENDQTETIQTAIATSGESTKESTLDSASGPSDGTKESSFDPTAERSGKKTEESLSYSEEGSDLGKGSDELISDPENGSEECLSDPGEESKEYLSDPGEGIEESLSDPGEETEESVSDLEEGGEKSPFDSAAKTSREGTKESTTDSAIQRTEETESANTPVKKRAVVRAKRMTISAIEKSKLATPPAAKRAGEETKPPTPPAQKRAGDETKSSTTPAQKRAGDETKKFITPAPEKSEDGRKAFSRPASKRAGYRAKESTTLALERTDDTFKESTTSAPKRAKDGTKAFATPTPKITRTRASTIAAPKRDGDGTKSATTDAEIKRPEGTKSTTDLATTSGKEAELSASTDEEMAGTRSEKLESKIEKKSKAEKGQVESKDSKNIKGQRSRATPSREIGPRTRALTRQSESTEEE